MSDMSKSKSPSSSPFRLAESPVTPSLFELLLTQAFSIARSTGSHILQNTGTIRSLTNMGIFDLPRPTVKHQTQHHKGHYFVLTFDSSAAVQTEIRRQLSLNPHMIRFSVVKLGDKLGGRRNEKGKIEDVAGRLEWNAAKTAADAGVDVGMGGFGGQDIFMEGILRDRK